MQLCQGNVQCALFNKAFKAGMKFICLFKTVSWLKFHFIPYVLTMKKSHSTYNCTDVIDVLCMIEEIRSLNVTGLLGDLWTYAPIDSNAHMNWVNAPNQTSLCQWMKNSFQNWQSPWQFLC